MKDKINVAELLKDCPKGMELDCTMFEDVKFIAVDEADKPICIRTGDTYRYLTKFGTWNFDENAKCVIFPKGKTTWEGFQRPFEDGDIIFTRADYDWVSIFKRVNEDNCYTYVDLCMYDSDLFMGTPTLCTIEEIITQRLATEEEKAKLFKVIKDNGYRWNSETKTLEKLIEPKFKVGDRITLKNYNDGKPIYKIIDVKDTYYVTDQGKLPFYYADSYELVPDKFDINTLVPFESRVLVRDNIDEKWQPAVWGYYDANTSYPYKTIGCLSRCCIPYEGNQHLLGTTDDCDEYFKTWE